MELLFAMHHHFHTLPTLELFPSCGQFQHIPTKYHPPLAAFLMKTIILLTTLHGVSNQLPWPTTNGVACSNTPMSHTKTANDVSLEIPILHLQMLL
jgi:hypothetical protein